jgi:hypothetical protein
MRKQQEKICVYCNKRFIFLVGSKAEFVARKYCSYKCNGDHHADQFKKERMGNGNPMYGKKPWNYGIHYDKKESVAKKNYRNKIYDIEGIITSGKSGSRNKKYLVVYNNGKYKMLHRIIVEKHLGRKLSDDEIVHHIDGDGLNNSINNLQIMTRSEHSRHHECGKNFEKKGGGGL